MSNLLEPLTLSVCTFWSISPILGMFGELFTHRFTHGIWPRGKNGISGWECDSPHQLTPCANPPAVLVCREKVENRGILVQIGLRHPKNANYSLQIGSEKADPPVCLRPHSECSPECSLYPRLSSGHWDWSSSEWSEWLNVNFC